MISGYLVVICEFTYATKGRSRYVPNEVRRLLMGRAQQHYETRQPMKGLPEVVLEKFNEKLIFPLYFSLIKFPRIEGGLLRNPAIGAIAVYRVVTNESTFKELCSFINEEIRRRVKVLKDLKILYANEVEAFG